MQAIEFQIEGERLAAKVAAGPDASAVLRQVRDLFVGRGYRLEETTGTRLVVRAPTRYTQTKQDALLMLSTATVTDEGDFLRFEGELSGLAWMQRFLYLFPLALGAFLALLFLTIGYFSGDMPPGIALLAPALALAPWVFLAPLLVRWLRARALSNVEALLHNARQLAQQYGA